MQGMKKRIREIIRKILYSLFGRSAIYNIRQLRQTKVLYSFVYVITLLRGKRPLLIRAWGKVRFGRIQCQNWGDELNLYMIKAMTGRPVFFQNYLLPSFQKAKSFMCIGSVLDFCCRKNSVVWGTGVKLRCKKLDERPSEVLAVRGPLTKVWLNKQGVECPTVYGDPALLLPLFVKVPKQEQVKIGLVPHYIDFKHPTLLRIVEKLGSDAILINLAHYKDWHDIIYKINQCQCVLSSSLHGLIVSDAYGVPNAWVQFSGVIGGDDFKYYDYFLSVNRKTREPLKMNVDMDINAVEQFVKSNWQPISYDIRPLIESCPFLSPDQKERYVSASLYS